MNGQNIAYIRVSSLDQNTARQLEGIEFDQVFEDHCSGKDTSRPALQECLKYLRKGDTLHVHSIDRLARNMNDLLRIVEDLKSRGVQVRFHKENITFDGAALSPMTELMFTMLGAFAQFERSIIKERQREGIAVAKSKGVYTGRKRKLSPDCEQEILDRISRGEKVSKIAVQYKMTRATVYNIINRNQKSC